MQDKDKLLRNFNKLVKDWNKFRKEVVDSAAKAEKAKRQLKKESDPKKIAALRADAYKYGQEERTAYDNAGKTRDSLDSLKKRLAKLGITVNYR